MDRDYVTLGAKLARVHMGAFEEAFKALESKEYANQVADVAALAVGKQMQEENMQMLRNMMTIRKEDKEE